MLYILPISHDVQFGKHPVLSTSFPNFLEEKITELGINLICEEASEDDLSSPVNTPLVKNISIKKSVSYIPIDFGDEERLLLGIPPAEELADKMLLTNANITLITQRTGIFPQEKFDEFRKEMATYEEIRELLWFEQIKDQKDKNILLIIGAGHLSTHRSSRGEGIDTLLKENGWRFNVLPLDCVAEKFKPTQLP